MSDIPPLLAASPASPAGAGPVGISNCSATGQGSELTAGSGTVVLLAYLAARAAGSLAVAIPFFWGMRHAGLSVGKNVHAFYPTMGLWETAAGALVGGLTMVCLSKVLYRKRVCDRAPTGAAWTWGRPDQIMFGFAVGILISQGSVVVGEAFKAMGIQPTSGPVAKMITSSGLPQTIWLLSLVLLAPLFEELLFRGVLYGSYRRSLGARKAAIYTTLIFTFMHPEQIIWFPPAAIVIAGYALAALWMRLRTAAIGPAIAAHFAINFMVALRTIC